MTSSEHAPVGPAPAGDSIPTSGPVRSTARLNAQIAISQFIWKPIAQLSKITSKKGSFVPAYLPGMSY